MAERKIPCRCGCGKKVTKFKNKYLKGHNKRGIKLTESTKDKISLSRQGKYNGKNNPNWKGGYFIKGIPLYNNFVERLHFVKNSEEV